MYRYTRVVYMFVQMYVVSAVGNWTCEQRYHGMIAEAIV